MPPKKKGEKGGGGKAKKAKAPEYATSDEDCLPFGLRVPAVVRTPLGLHARVLGVKWEVRAARAALPALPALPASPASPANTPVRSCAASPRGSAASRADTAVASAAPSPPAGHPADGGARVGAGSQRSRGAHVSQPATNTGVVPAGRAAHSPRNVVVACDAQAPSRRRLAALYPGAAGAAHQPDRSRVQALHRRRATPARPHCRALRTTPPPPTSSRGPPHLTSLTLVAYALRCTFRLGKRLSSRRFGEATRATWRWRANAHAPFLIAGAMRVAAAACREPTPSGCVMRLRRASGGSRAGGSAQARGEEGRSKASHGQVKVIQLETDGRSHS